jgi:hypothetical protein
MSVDEHVTMTIVQDGVSVSRPGFGTPAGLSVNVGWVERSRTYANLTEGAADFDTDSPEYLFLRATFSQSPRPPFAKILRAEGQPTQRYSLNVVNVKDSHTYEITVVFQGGVEETIEFTSDATADDGEIVAGLVAALNLVSGKNFTAAGASSPFTVTGDAAGDWFSLQILDFTDLDIVQDHAEPSPSLATDLAAIQTEDPDWYGLHTFYNSTAYVNAAAAWIESNKKLYMGESCDSTALVTAEASGTDALDDLDENNYTRSLPIYAWAPHEMMGAALMGRCLPLNPGTETWAYKGLAGVTTPPLTSTHRGNLDDRQATYMKNVGGVDFTWQGKVADSVILYADMRRLLDWLESEIKFGVFESLVGAPAKVPFTNGGISSVKNRVWGPLLQGIRRGAIAEDPAPTVTAPTISEISASDKKNRILPDVNFTATATSAIHQVDIFGVVSP